MIGTRAGIPDFLLFIPSQGYHGLFLEMKTTGGRISPAQTEMMALLTSQGYVCKVCYGWDFAKGFIEGYLGKIKF